MTLYSEHNPTAKKDSEESKVAMAKVTTPEEQRQSKNMLERMLHFLNAGYKIKSINERQDNNSFETVLEYANRKETFLHEFPLNAVLTPKKREPQLVKEIESILEGIKQTGV